MRKNAVKDLKFPPTTYLHIFIIALTIFILGVQLGIKQGRTLEREDILNNYDYCISD